METTIPTPAMQDKINTLTTELVKTRAVLDQTRELLKSAEQESSKLKVTLEGVINNKKTGIFHRIMGDIVEMADKVKFQSPIVRKGS